MGWFYPPPPPPVQIPPPWYPVATAAGFTNQPARRDPAAWATLVSTWPVESWGAQTAPPSAGFYNATVFLPPTPPSGPITDQLDINFLWPRETWSAQSAPLTAAAWSLPVQAASYPAPLLAVRNALLTAWIDSGWNAQSEAATASGIAIPVPPPSILPPSFFAPIMLWLRDDWKAQTGASIAGALPQVITAVPQPIPQFQSLFWPRDDWKAQSSATIAGILAPATNAIPFSNVWLLSSLRSTWSAEAWNAQVGASIAARFATSTYQSFRNDPLLRLINSLWPQEAWGSQFLLPIGGTSAQATQNPPFRNDPLMRLLFGSWPQEAWSSQIPPPPAALFAGVFIQPSAIPWRNDPLLRSVTMQWLKEDWGPQHGAALGVLFASLAPPPGLVTGIMPNVVGMNYYMALRALQIVGVYVPVSVLDFNFTTITVQWAVSSYPGGIVSAQSIAAGLAVVPNQPITLTVSTYPFGSDIDSPPDWRQRTN